MENNESKKRETGFYQFLGSLSYFIPYPLPPANPPLELSPEIMNLAGEALFSLGQLNGISKRIPDQKRFLKSYIIKEALLSSEIEGIHTTIVDVLTGTTSGIKTSKDTELVINYIKALDVALNMIQQDGLPISSRVILAAHEALMNTTEEQRATPGFYRKQAVRVGNLIPAPAQQVPELITELEKYINDPEGLPAIIKTGLTHIQFETIHPFLDGNGRIGRLLIVLMLVHNGLLDTPLLYPSYYFKKHHMEYYYALDRVRTQGDFEGWITYFLTAIKESSIDAQHRAHDIENLDHNLQMRIQTDPIFAKTKETALSMLNVLFQTPIFDVTFISKKIDKAYNTTNKIIQQFIDAGIVVEHTHTKRNKLYRFDTYIQLLEKEY